MIIPRLPQWCSWLKSWAFVVQQPQPKSLADSSVASMGTPKAGLGLGWLENTLDFASWVVSCLLSNLQKSLKIPMLQVPLMKMDFGSFCGQSSVFGHLRLQPPSSDQCNSV